MSYLLRLVVPDKPGLLGAVATALGRAVAGVMGSDPELVRRLIEIGRGTGEPLWELPLIDEYVPALASPIADIKNIGGRWAGACTAAAFLKYFVKDTAWAHLDIAGMAWARRELPLVPRGATAFGVRLLNQLVIDNFEKK